MKVMKYYMLMVMVIGITNAGSSNDDTDKDSSTSLKRKNRQNYQYYAYVNPKFTALTNRMNQMSASVRAFRHQNKMTASSKLNLLRSHYTKPIITFANSLRPASINTIQDTLPNTVYQKSILNRKATNNINTIRDTLRNTVGLYQKPADVLNRPASTNINTIRGTLKNTHYQRPDDVLNRPATKLNTIQGSLKNTLYQKSVLNRKATTHINTIQAPTVNTISKPELSNVNTVGIKTQTLPNRIVYTNPITGGKTIFVRNLDENTYSQPEKAVNVVVQLTTPSPYSIVPLPIEYKTQTKISANQIPYYHQINTPPVPTAETIVDNYIQPATSQFRGHQLTTPSPNSIVPLPIDYNTQTKISANYIPYYQINTPPVPTEETIVDNYIQPATSQFRGDQNFARMNTNQLPTIRANPIPAPNLANYDLPSTTFNTQRPVQGTLMNNQMQPPNTVNNRQITAGNPRKSSQITNRLDTPNTYPTNRYQQTNQINSGYQSSSNQVYTNSVNPPQPTPKYQLPTSTDNALNFVRAFFQQLMQQHPSKNQYQIATSPTSKYNM